MRQQPEAMSRRDVLRRGGLGAAAIWAGRALAGPLAAMASDRPGQKRPNLVLIFADDLGYGDLGCYGGGEIPTPNIDGLAAGGVRFTDGYVTAPVCSPSRAGLLTGRYQQRFGHEFNGGDTPGATPETFGMPVHERTLADELSAAGYATGIVGKWHLGMAERFRPGRRGFAESFCFLGGWHNYVDPQNAGHLFRNDLPAKAPPGYLTETFTREAQAFIEHHRAEPFFLYLPYNAPHTPLQATPKYLTRFEHIQDEKRRTYMAMVSALDDGVGEIMQTLRALNLEEDTLVVFLSDNGAPTHVTGGSNQPLRGRKAQVFEGGIRVPFLASWKGRIQPGVSHEPVMSFDVFTTGLALAGAPIPTERAIDGVNLLPLLTTGKVNGPLHAGLFWRMGAEAAVRRGQWKLVRSGEAPWQLFDVASDPSESTDLAASNPQRAQELLAAYQDWEGQLAPNDGAKAAR